MTMYVTRAGDLLDWICWRHYGVSPGAVEMVLTSNPGLADRGPVLHAGIEIRLPVLPDPVEEVETVRLWD